MPGAIKVTWIAPERVIGPLLVAAFVLGALGSRSTVAHAAVTSPASLTSAAANYLLGSENADGGFGSAPGQPSDQLYAGWAALGLASAGHDLNQLGDAESLISYIARGAGTHDVGALERTILVVRAAGQSPRSFGGRDLIAALESRFRGDGSISDQVNLTAFAILALRADGLGWAGSNSRTLGWLVRQQDSDGGFSFAGRGGSSDVDDTGAALEALAGDRAAASVMSRAVAFLRRQQDRDGGFPSQPGMGSNAQSTAWAIQGLDAAGVSPATLHRGGAGSPLAYLDSLVGANGAVRYSRGVTQTPVWVTGEALMAMEGKPLPIAAPVAPAAPRRARAARDELPHGDHPALRAAGDPRGRERAPAHTGAGRRRPQHPPLVPPVPTARNQVLAGNFAHAVGVITALALAPVGLG